MAMAVADKQWLAGLVEGDGALTVHQGRPRLKVAMTDRDVVERAAALMSDATVHSNGVPRPGSTQQWTAGRSGRRAVELMLELAPLLGERRRARILELTGELPQSGECGWAWLAGLLEAEGSFAVHRCGARRLPEVVINMTDRDVLECVASVVGSCRVLGPYGGDERRKPYWRWKRGGRGAVELMERILPEMGERRSGQIAAALRA